MEETIKMLADITKKDLERVLVKPSKKFQPLIYPSNNNMSISFRHRSNGVGKTAVARKYNSAIS